jgi:hypothetical protein
VEDVEADLERMRVGVRGKRSLWCIAIIACSGERQQRCTGDDRTPRHGGVLLYVRGGGQVS